jgi:MFS transporter, MFS domain-containing protein family, molybdate-anion transporter
LAGFIAQIVANSFGYVAPFDTALLVFIIMIIFIIFNWSENYGDSDAQIQQSFKTAWNSIKSDRKILLLGLIQSLFEGPMYVFILEWTPALTIDKTSSSLPYGYIFAAYMIAVMIGSNLFKILIENKPVEKFLKIILLIAAFTLTLPIFFPQNQFLIFAAFILFEMCVGIFWSSMSTLRSQLVPGLLQIYLLFKFCFLKN